MATITQTQTPALKQRPKLVCFSFAAYAKILIDYLKSCNIPIQPGLSEAELNSIEGFFSFSFPSDLRSILQEGLPVGHGFPNWRSSSYEQLRILINLPHLGILKEVSKGNLWCSSWGVKPDDKDEALAMAKKTFSKAPVLVPVYRHCYIPSKPNAAGNPVFYVNGGDVSVLRYDICVFFQEFEFFQHGSFMQDFLRKSSSKTKVPAWAATKERRVEYWTEVAEERKRTLSWNTWDTRGWWNGDLRLKVCMEDVFCRLRNGGWKEEEVREMMMLERNSQDEETKKSKAFELLIDKEAVMRHLRVIIFEMFQTEQSTDDVVYSLDSKDYGFLPRNDPKN